jgi:flagellar biosynthetic protein FliR
MTPDFIIAYFCAFVRAGALLASAPTLGTSVPVMVRAFLAAILAAAAAPILPQVAAPESWLELVLLAAHHAVFGLVLGGCLQLLTQAFSAAGGLADTQAGLASAQVFNPALGTQGAPLANFKGMLGATLIFALDGHHLILNAFLKSFQSTPTPAELAAQAPDAVLPLIGQLTLLSLQMGLPILAATFLIDLAAGLVNKAVPQTQPFLLALPAKLALGILALAVGLPVMAAATQRGLEEVSAAWAAFMGGA